MSPARLALAALAGAALALPAAAHIQLYGATLSGAAEFTPNASTGTGSVTVTIDDHSFTMRVQADFANLLPTTAAGAANGVSAAHIHCCTANAGTGTSGVATPTPTFPGFPGLPGTAGVLAGSYDQTFDMTLASSWNAGFLSANGNDVNTAFSALITAMDQGRTYFNIHSAAFGGGEIRGFLTPVPEPGSAALCLAGLTLVGTATWRRRSDARV